MKEMSPRPASHLPVAATSGGSPEIRSLTGLRGVAAVYVVAYHFIMMANLYSDNDNSFQFNPTEIIKCFFGHGYLAVDLFFVLSGYVMALTHWRDFSTGFSRPAMTSFLYKRFSRLYPLYIVTTLACFALAWSGIDEHTHSFTHNAAKLLMNTLLLQAVGGGVSLDQPAWSIGTEAIAYLLFPIGCILIQPNHKWRGISAAIVCISTVVFLAMLPEAWSSKSRILHHTWLDFSDTRTPFPLLRCIVEFMLGMLTWRFGLTRLGRFFTRLPQISLLFGIAAVVSVALPNSDLIFVLLMPGLILSLSSDRGPLAWMLGLRATYVAGILSYSFYLTHYPIGLALIELKSLPITPIYSIILALTLTLLISVITYTVVEKPARRYLRSLSSRPMQQDPGPARAAV